MAMFSTGNQELNTFSSEGSGKAFVAVDNAKVEDGAITISVGTGSWCDKSGWTVGTLSQRLQGVNTTTKLPTGSWVKGIIYHTNRASPLQGNTLPCDDNNIVLIKNNTPVGNDKGGSTSYAYNNVYQTRDFGSSTDTWGLTNLNDVYVNAADFGIGHVALTPVSGGSASAYVDTLKINIHYNPTGIFMSM